LQNQPANFTADHATPWTPAGAGTCADDRYSMIPKSVQRLSEKIMRKQKTRAG
jgi:hypothetical protein